MKRIIFLFFIISFIECLYYKDLCFPDEKKEFKCFGRLNYNCGDFVCTKNQYTCHILSIFSARKCYESFVKKINSCPEPLEKKWSTNDVCKNTKQCEKPSIHRLWSIQIKLIACKCIGKYSYKCNDDYCGLNKMACDGLNTKMVKIKKCTYT